MAVFSTGKMRPPSWLFWLQLVSSLLLKVLTEGCLTDAGLFRPLGANTTDKNLHSTGRCTLQLPGSSWRPVWVNLYILLKNSDRMIILVLLLASNLTFLLENPFHLDLLLIQMAPCYTAVYAYVILQVESFTLGVQLYTTLPYKLTMVSYI